MSGSKVCYINHTYSYLLSTVAQSLRAVVSLLVAVHFRQVTGQADCTVDRIRSKFNSLIKTRKPTGDPTLPPEIKRAKLIRKRIDERVHSGCSDEQEDWEMREESSTEEQGGSSSSDGLGLSLHLSQPSRSSSPSPLSSTSSSSSDDSSASLSSPSSSSSSSPSVHKRKRLDVDGISAVIINAVAAQTKSTEAMSQAMVQNSEMIRLLASLLASQQSSQSSQA